MNNEEELYNLHSSSNIIRVTTSRRKRWLRNAYKIFIGIPEKKRT
jgi:hypothetical protein